jgi:hypothetical protein
MTDCSVPLESGALMAFSSNEGMANTRNEYGNVVLLHLLYFDKAVADAKVKDSDSYSETAVTLVARQVLDSLRKFTGIFLKECRSHVYRAPAHWMHSNKSAEFSGVKDSFEDLLRKVFDEATKEPKVTVVIVQLSLVIAMLETEKFCSQSFYDTTETKTIAEAWRRQPRNESYKRLTRSFVWSPKSYASSHFRRYMLVSVPLTPRGNTFYYTKMLLTGPRS